MDINRADIVVSINGRDKGKRFFVIDRDEAYALLCDGKTRRIEKPKRKKIKHIRLDSTSDSRAAQKIRNGDKLTNSEIRRSIAEYLVGNLGVEGGM